MRTALVYFPLFVWVVTLVTFVRPLPARRLTRWAWAAFLLLCALKFALFERIGGDAFNPELPVACVWTSNVLYSGMMLLSAFSVVARMCRVRGRIVWLLPLLSWGLAVRGVYNGLRVPDVHEVTLAYADLPTELDGYRIAHLTDLHVSASMRRWRTEAIVRRVNALEPDLIVCTGDIVDGRVMTERDDVAPLRDLTAADGVYFCTGNHEYYRDAANWLRQYREWGFSILENTCVFPRASLCVAGVPDRAGGALSPLPDVAKAFSTATNGAFRVLLSHRPFDPEGAFPLPSYDLQLSGHTHGGIMPGLNLLVKSFNHGYVRGLYSIGRRTKLYVSSGAGQWAGFPIRFFNDAEITLVTLRAMDK